MYELAKKGSCVYQVGVYPSGLGASGANARRVDAVASSMDCVPHVDRPSTSAGLAGGPATAERSKPSVAEYRRSVSGPC